MALKEILSETRDGTWFALPSFRQSAVQKARVALAMRFTEADSLPPVVELEDVAARLERAANSGSLSEISRKDWAKAAWCIWLRSHALAEVPGFLKVYLDRVHQANRRSLLKKLISAYLRDYGPAQANLEKVGKFLARRVGNWDWVWADRQEVYGLFDRTGPAKVANAYLKCDEPIGIFLEDLGLGGDLSFCGLSLAAYGASIDALRKLNDEEFDQLLRRVLDWSADEDGLRYPGAEGRLADALLLRWHNKNPPKTTQAAIEEFLLTHFKDPRIPGTPGSKWSHVSEDAKGVILRWLVGVALEQFLQVVDKVAMLGQWRYRKAFWTAYYRAGVIDEAWVAFARKGRIVAKQSFGDMRGFAELDGSAVSPDHAVLLMKIGGLTIADWSHNGKCHIWTEANRDAPKLYRKSYRRHELVEGSSNQGVVHAGAPNGTWQSKIATYIDRQTNIRLNRTDYMPKRRR